MGLVVQQFEIFKFVVENTRASVLDNQSGSCPGGSLQLRSRLVQVIVIEMHIAQRMNEIAKF